jgi:hypothetical protein
MYEAETQIYPSIPVIKSEQETNEIINQKINEGLHKERIKEMISQRNELERDFKHHRRWKKYWNKFDLGIKVTGGILLGGTTIVGVLSGIFIPGMLVIPVIIGAVDVGVGTIFVGFELGVIRRKKNYHKEKCKLIKEYLDKSWHYIEGSRDDGIITLKEIEGYNMLMNEYRSKMEGIKNVDIDIIQLQKEVQKEAHSQVQELLKKQLVEKMVEEEQTKFGEAKRSLLNVPVSVAYSTLSRR